MVEWFLSMNKSTKAYRLEIVFDCKLKNIMQKTLILYLILMESMKYARLSVLNFILNSLESADNQSFAHSLIRK